MRLHREPRTAEPVISRAELWEWILWRLDQVQPSDRLQGQIPLFINPTGRVAARRWLGNALRTRWNLYARQVLGVHVPMYEGTKHSTATDAIRRGVSLEQIQAALRHADAASTRVYAKLARSGSFDIPRNPARVSSFGVSRSQHVACSPSQLEVGSRVEDREIPLPGSSLHRRAVS